MRFESTFRLLACHDTQVPFCQRILQSERSDKLEVTSKGSGGLSQLKEALEDSKASYAYARVTYSNDKESQREKFILVIWIGSECKVMRKAKVSTLHRGGLPFYPLDSYMFSLMNLTIYFDRFQCTQPMSRWLSKSTLSRSQQERGMI